MKFESMPVADRFIAILVGGSVMAFFLVMCSYRPITWSTLPGVMANIGCLLCLIMAAIIFLEGLFGKGLRGPTGTTNLEAKEQ